MLIVASDKMVMIARLRPEKVKDLAGVVLLDARVALTVAVGVPVTMPAAAEKEDDVVDSATSALSGTLSHEAEESSETLAPPEGAGWESAIVHVDCVPETIVAGLQTRFAIVNGACSVTVPVEEAEPKLAVITTN